MNLLSHALLSPPDHGTLVGNLIADWVKGRARLALPESFHPGLTLHRRIDAFTDTHPLVEHCSNLLAPRWGRYSTVLVDILFDHCLAIDWHHFCPLPRRDFIASVYAALRAHLALIPERARYGVCVLLADDWFNAYATLDGIALSLTRLSGRLRHNIELAPAVDDFLTHRPAFLTAFHQFLPQIRTHLTPHANAIPPAMAHQ